MLLPVISDASAELSVGYTVVFLSQNEMRLGCKMHRNAPFSRNNFPGRRHVISVKTGNPNLIDARGEEENV